MFKYPATAEYFSNLTPLNPVHSKTSFNDTLEGRFPPAEKI